MRGLWLLVILIMLGMTTIVTSLATQTKPAGHAVVRLHNAIVSPIPSWRTLTVQLYNGDTLDVYPNDEGPLRFAFDMSARDTL